MYYLYESLKHWLETLDSDYAIIMEDDCSLETVQCWNFNGTTPLHMLHTTMMNICTGDIMLKFIICE